MIFTQPLYGKVLRGEKTQTRRLVQPGDPATRFRLGQRKAVQKGRGIHGEAHIIFTAVRRERLDRKPCDLCDGHQRLPPHQGFPDGRSCPACEGTGEQPRLTIHDAKAEGFKTSDELRLYWIGLHDKAWAERWEAGQQKTPEGQTIDEFNQAALERFATRWASKEVWVLTFDLDRSEEPRFLMQGSPLTEGGKARLMSNRKVKPGKAKPREMGDIDSPEAKGYSTSAARAVPHEPEPVDAQTQDRFSKEGHQGFVARAKAREIDREHLAAEERMRLVRIEARAQGVSIEHLERAILEKLRKAERKVHHRAA